MRIVTAVVAAAALIVGAEAYTKQDRDAYMSARVLDVFKWNQSAVVEVLAFQCATRITCVDKIRPGFSYRLSSALNMQAPIILFTRFGSGSPLTINDAIPGFVSPNPLAYTPQVLNPECGTCMRGTEESCSKLTPSIIKTNLNALQTQNFTSWSITRTPVPCMEFVTLWAIANEAEAKKFIDDNKVASCATGRSAKDAGTFEDDDCTTLFLAGDDVLSYLGPVESLAGQVYQNASMKDFGKAVAAAMQMYTAFNSYVSMALPLTLQTAFNFTKNLGAFYAVNARLDKTFERIANVMTKNQTHLTAVTPMICPNVFCADYYRPGENWVFKILSSTRIPGTSQATMLDLTLLFMYGALSPSALFDGVNNMNACLQSCSVNAQTGVPSNGCFGTVTNFVSASASFSNLNCFDWMYRWRTLVVGEAKLASDIQAPLAGYSASQCNAQTAQAIPQSLSNWNCGKLFVNLANVSEVVSIIGSVYNSANSAVAPDALLKLQEQGLDASIMLPAVKTIVDLIRSNAYATGVVLSNQATNSPTKLPTKSPTKNPTKLPTKNPTKPTAAPTKNPTANPGSPTSASTPTTAKPTTKAPTVKTSGASSTVGVVLTQFAIVAMSVVGLFAQ